MNKFKNFLTRSTKGGRRYYRDRRRDTTLTTCSRTTQGQLEVNVRSWTKRLETFTQDESTEPDRIRARYEVRKTRVQPIGLVYLWPESK